MTRGSTQKRHDLLKAMIALGRSEQPDRFFRVHEDRIIQDLCSLSPREGAKFISNPGLDTTSESHLPSQGWATFATIIREELGQTPCDTPSQVRGDDLQGTEDRTRANA